MIDLNKYYVAKTYDGVSGNYAGRPGFVPQATTGDAGKFLRADGTWASINISGLDLNISVMSGATSSTDGASGLVPKPLAGDDKKYLRGDGTWSDPTISTIQFINGDGTVILDVENYDTFCINTSVSNNFIYSGFEVGKSINVYISGSHAGYLPHTFPENTKFSELGDDNIIYSFSGYTTRLLLQNVGFFVVNFSSITKNVNEEESEEPPLYYYGSATPYYYGAGEGGGGVGIGLELLDFYLNELDIFDLLDL